MKRLLLTATVSVLLFCEIGLAQTSCDSTPTTYQNVLACAEERSPEIQAARLELERAKAQAQAATQRPNPELSTESFYGNSGSENETETDIAIGFPIELGDKRAARKSAAQSGINSAEAKIFEAQARIKTQVLLKLHRLRQALREQEIVDEAIGTFAKLVTQYSRRPGLSPEQQVSLTVFQLSKSEYDLKKSATNDEILSLGSFFQLTTGLPIEVVRKALPSIPQKWPTLAPSKTGISSPQTKALEAELRLANAELEMARSEAWPTLTIGPSVKLISQGGTSGQLYGLNLSLPLPVFNTNAGGKAVAAANANIAQAKRQYGLREQELRRDELLNTYTQAVHALSISLSHSEIERHHAAAEVLFTKGVIPSSLIIEAHRTSLDLERTRHERELRVLEAWLEWQTLEGTILEVNL